MTGGMIAALLLAQAAVAEEVKPETFLPKEILAACPAPQKLAPYVRGCTTNFIPVEWAQSCSRALEKLTIHANALLQTGFAAEALKSVGSQSGKFGNTAADLSLAKLSLDQLILAGKQFHANQKAYQALVAYPGGEDKNLIRMFRLTGVYSAFKCVKSSVDAVGAEITATEKKLAELERASLAAGTLRKATNGRDESLNGSVNLQKKPPQASTPGGPVVRQAAGKRDTSPNTITGVDKALENKRQAEQLLQKKP